MLSPFTSFSPFGRRRVVVSGAAGFALVAHAASATASNSANSTGSINTTGADLLIVGVSRSEGRTVTISDSKSNTWTPLTLQGSGDPRTQIFYCRGGTVGTGHTFTATSDGLPAFPSICVAAFSGSHASPFDQENGNFDASGNPVQTGSVTPSQNGELLITHIGYFAGTGCSINSGFTITDEALSGTSYATSMAYKIQTSAGAENPAWTLPASHYQASTRIATFKSA